MDICSKAFQGETTGRMVEQAAAPGSRQTTPRVSSALSRTPLPYGDITGLTTWFILGMRSEGKGTLGDLDAAA